MNFIVITFLHLITELRSNTSFSLNSIVPLVLHWVEWHTRCLHLVHRSTVIIHTWWFRWGSSCVYWLIVEAWILIWVHLLRLIHTHVLTIVVVRLIRWIVTLHLVVAVVIRLLLLIITVIAIWIILITLLLIIVLIVIVLICVVVSLIVLSVVIIHLASWIVALVWSLPIRVCVLVLVVTVLIITLVIVIIRILIVVVLIAWARIVWFSWEKACNFLWKLISNILLSIWSLNITLKLIVELILNSLAFPDISFILASVWWYFISRGLPFFWWLPSWLSCFKRL